jgi:prepilin-type N-terminal cleavage/methylation domain-containing protein
MQAKNLRRRMMGMTLIELLVVVAVVAILASIASGSYRAYMLRANRTGCRRLRKSSICRTTPTP